MPLVYITRSNDIVARARLQHNKSKVQRKRASSLITRFLFAVIFKILSIPYSKTSWLRSVRALQILFLIFQLSPIILQGRCCYLQTVLPKVVGGRCPEGNRTGARNKTHRSHSFRALSIFVSGTCAKIAQSYKGNKNGEKRVAEQSTRELQKERIACILFSSY